MKYKNEKVTILKNVTYKKSNVNCYSDDSSGREDCATRDELHVINVTDEALSLIVNNWIVTNQVVKVMVDLICVCDSEFSP